MTLSHPVSHLLAHPVPHLLSHLKQHVQVQELTHACARCLQVLEQMMRTGWSAATKRQQRTTRQLLLLLRAGPLPTVQGARAARERGVAAQQVLVQKMRTGWLAATKRPQRTTRQLFMRLRAGPLPAVHLSRDGQVTLAPAHTHARRPGAFVAEEGPGHD